MKYRYLTAAQDISVKTSKMRESIEKEGEKEYFVVDDLFEFKCAETGSEYIALPCDRFEVSATYRF